MNTTLKGTGKSTPRITKNITQRSNDISENSLINLPQKVRTTVSKTPLLITKNTTRNNLDEAAKKPTMEQWRELSSLTNSEEETGYRPLEEWGGY